MLVKVCYYYPLDLFSSEKYCFKRVDDEERLETLTTRNMCD